MTTLEEQLALSVELSHCSPALRRYVQRLQVQVRNAGLKRLMEDLERDAAASADLPALLRPQI
jgi:hypothetical protein